MEKFYTQLQKMTSDSRRYCETDLQGLYKEKFSEVFRISLSDIQSLDRADSYMKLNVGPTRVIAIAEAKFKDSDANLKYAPDMKKVLAQLITYVHKFIISGEDEVPIVGILEDDTYMVIFPISKIYKYAEDDSLKFGAPCKASSNKALMDKLNSDDELNNFRIFDMKTESVANDACPYMVECARGQIMKSKANEQSIVNIFNAYKDMILDCPSILKNNNDIVSTFLGIITDSENYYQHPSSKNLLITPRGKVPINAAKYNNFISNVHIDYSPSEKDLFISIRDRLVEDMERRRKGEFYTPLEFVNLAHDMASESFGDNWKDSVVWDCCCGTKNLTRDYKFKELYCSTLEQGELDSSSRYNREAVSFKFDFLDGDRTELVQKAPGLVTALRENKPITFFINPPYGTSGNFANKEQKKGINQRTKSTDDEFEKFFNFKCENIYGQFLQRIMFYKRTYHLTNVKIVLYSPTLFITGPKWKQFRKEFFKDFKFVDGAQFNAGEFADVSAKWSIAITIWESGEEKRTCFNIDNFVREKFLIKKISSSSIYNTDNGIIKASDWVKKEVKGKFNYDVPSFSSGIKSGSTTSSRGNIPKSFGYMFNKSNNIDVSSTGVSIFCSAYSDGHGFSIIAENFEKTMSLFTARKVINKTAENSKSEYLAPDESSPEYEDFKNDAVVFSLFNTSSNQTSLRNIYYEPSKDVAPLKDSQTIIMKDDNLWDIKNNFFWMNREEIKALANQYHVDSAYCEASSDFDRFTYLWIKDHYKSLSPSARSVLDAASNILRNTFQYRNEFDTKHPEYQIKNWDCGWYQIKAMAKEYDAEEYNDFVNLYKEFKDELVPQVYEVGFLLK